MYLWVIRATFDGVGNVQVKIKWFSPPERGINHLELPYLVDLVIYLEWYLNIKAKISCSCRAELQTEA